MTDYSVEIRLNRTPRSIDRCGVSASRIGGGSVASASIAIKRCPSRVQAHDGLFQFSWTNTRRLSSTRDARQSHARCVLRTDEETARRRARRAPDSRGMAPVGAWLRDHDEALRDVERLLAVSIIRTKGTAVKRAMIRNQLSAISGAGVRLPLRVCFISRCGYWILWASSDGAQSEIRVACGFAGPAYRVVHHRAC
jgi:hypothetical protein